MTRVLAVNGSPSWRSGNTARMLSHFAKGMEGAGAQVTTVNASEVRPRPCSGEMSCWYRDPGRCHIQDGMQSLYPLLRESDVLVLATPVYIPLPGDMQNLINRLCPLAEPMLSTDWGRTKARLREGARLRKAALVATGAWWEAENLDILVRIVKELCLKMSIEFAGAVLRPHALMLERDPQMAEMVYQDVLLAGEQLATTGQMSQGLLDRISAPLVEEGELRELYNRMNRKASGQDR